MGIVHPKCLYFYFYELVLGYLLKLNKTTVAQVYFLYVYKLVKLQM